MSTYNTSSSSGYHPQGRYRGHGGGESGPSNYDIRECRSHSGPGQPPIFASRPRQAIAVDLRRAEHPWVRRTQRPAGEDGEIEKLFRKFRGILNKLTPQKFKKLAEQALNLKIDSEQRLKGCIDMIFTKAVEEPKYSIAYANLCKVMSTIKVEVLPEEGKAKVVTFRRVLLTNIQQEFESDKKKPPEEESFIWESKSRKRSLGNIRFLGELFKLQMLSETIMHECFVRLLRSSSDDESLECCAVLMTVTGKVLDKPEAKARMDSYFTRIAEIIKKGRIPLRIKFKLQDVQELRDNKWVPRARVLREESLRTIDQIHHEAKVEWEKEKQWIHTFSIQ